MAAKPKKITNDSWINVLTGLADASRDKRESTSLRIDHIPYERLLDLYRSSDIAARIVDLVPDEMTREWMDVRVEGDEPLGETVGAMLEDLEVKEKFLQALKLERLAGGAAILIGANDGTANLSEPLNERRVESVDFITVLDASECTPTRYYENPATKEFGQPEFYDLNPSGSPHGNAALANVHASRIIRFGGNSVNRRQFQQSINRGWGDSVLLRCARLIRDFDVAWSGVGFALGNFNQSIFRMQGLANALLADKDKTVIKRMQMIDMSRSMIRAVLLDKENEEYENVAIPMSGVPETLDRFATRLSAASSIPVTLLFGQSPAGLNATGASDVRFFYDSVKASQNKQLAPALKRLIKLLFISKSGPSKGREPDSWGVSFRSLWQQTDLEKSEVRLKMSQVDRTYFDMGVLTAEDIAESRFGGDEYSIDTQVNTSDLRAREVNLSEAANIRLPAEPGDVSGKGIEQGVNLPAGETFSTRSGG